jgi:hypothetical protein
MIGERIERLAPDLSLSGALVTTDHAFCLHAYIEIAIKPAATGHTDGNRSGQLDLQHPVATSILSRHSLDGGASHAKRRSHCDCCSLMARVVIGVGFFPTGIPLVGAQH